MRFMMLFSIFRIVKLRYFKRSVVFGPPTFLNTKKALMLLKAFFVRDIIKLQAGGSKTYSVWKTLIKSSEPLARSSPLRRDGLNVCWFTKTQLNLQTALAPFY
jgi:hypothetical protein